MQPSAYHVQWFIHGDVRTDVTVRIAGGHMVDVLPGKTVDAIDLGPVALVDGLVNAHTHLEFSGMQSPLPAGNQFTDWIRQVVAHRRDHSQDVDSSIRSGLRESIEAGTTLIGEIATSHWFRDQSLVSQFRGVIFQEILGLSPERVTEQQELAQCVVELSAPSAKIGISPHAPYSTHLDLVRTAVQLSQQTGCPLAMHLAETKAELELLREGCGEFQQLLQGFGLWRDDLFAPGQRPLDYLKILAQAPSALVIHGNYLDDTELSLLADNPQLTLVYCPRTHAHFAHDEHPWQRALQRGVRVALGTDSRASNPDLSIFAELQFLAAQHPELSHLELLKLGSTAGRTALGFDSFVDDADLTLIQLAPHSVPERDLFAATSRVVGAMINGRWASLSSPMNPSGN